MTSQVAYPIQGAANGVQQVPGEVPMTLDLNGNPQAVSNVNPIPIIDAYAAPQVATWTSATGVNTAQSMATAGMDNVALTIQVAGAVTAGAISFEVFDGANWVIIKSARATSYNTDSTYSLIQASGTNIQGWTIPVAGFPQFRARLSTAITGAGSVLITSIVSSAPDVSIVTAGLDPQQALHPGALTLNAQQVVAVGASSTASAAVNTLTNRVVLCSTVACWVAFGSSPTAAANTAGSIYVPANYPMPPIAVTPGVTKIAVIQAASGGYLSVIESV